MLSREVLLVVALAVLVVQLSSLASPAQSGSFFSVGLCSRREEMEGDAGSLSMSRKLWE